MLGNGILQNLNEIAENAYKKYIKELNSKLCSNQFVQKRTSSGEWGLVRVDYLPVLSNFERNLLYEIRKRELIMAKTFLGQRLCFANKMSHN